MALFIGIIFLAALGCCWRGGVSAEKRTCRRIIGPIEGAIWGDVGAADVLGSAGLGFGPGRRGNLCFSGLGLSGPMLRSALGMSVDGLRRSGLCIIAFGLALCPASGCCIVGRPGADLLLSDGLNGTAALLRIPFQALGLQQSLLDLKR